MKKHHSSKSGAALVIALGFLAILTIMIIAFVAQSRSERVAGRDYLNSARTRHLLHTALSRAMEDIDADPGVNFPSFFALGSAELDGMALNTSINFTVEEEYIPLGNDLIWERYLLAKNAAVWQTITTPDTNATPIGRVGYIIVNTSGLLDANHVGSLPSADLSTEHAPRISVADIQLNTDLISEMNPNASQLIGGIPQEAESAHLAFVYNRENGWKRFETIRDLQLLNNSDRGNVITGDIESFSTFSHTLPPQTPRRSFMGTNLASVVQQEAVIRQELIKNPAINTDFVMNQLFDYLDTDRIPRDVDFSVEAVPLINEIALSCSFYFSPEITESAGEDGTPEITVTSVEIECVHSLDLETWYPFTVDGADDDYTVSIDDSPLQDGFLPFELFGELTDENNPQELVGWLGDFPVQEQANHPGELPFNFQLYTATNITTVTTPSELVALFEDLETDLEFPSISCTDGEGNLVDRVEDLLIPMEFAVANDLAPLIEDLSTNIFDGATATAVSNFNFMISMESIDPRLNSDGSETNFWADDTGAGIGEDAGSLGEINDTAILAHSIPTDTIGKIFVRNDDRIDSPWEFTYFLYNPSYPWKTFQMLEAYDDDNTRRILENLSPFPNDRSPPGRINPYSPHTNVIASVFLNMPTQEFEEAPLSHFEKVSTAKKAAELFMTNIRKNRWNTNPAEISQMIPAEELSTLINTDNPWVLESYFRNSYELFNLNDTLYTILLAAQSGTDTDGDGSISDQEVRSREQAVAYVWRDKDNEKSAVVFFGLSDTLRTTIGQGQSWGELLGDFNPTPSSP